jgi:hypothetical protein
MGFKYRSQVKAAYDQVERLFSLIGQSCGYERYDSRLHPYPTVLFMGTIMLPLGVFAYKSMVDAIRP